MKKQVLFLVVFLSTNTFAQTRFDRAVNVPVTENGNNLRLAFVGGINFPWISPIDLNGDGRDDMFLLDHQNNRILTFVNNGNSNADLAWDYAPEYATQFPPFNRWAFLYDYDCDGKPDFFTLSKVAQCNGIDMYHNVTTGSALQWLLTDSCMQETLAGVPQPIYATSVSIPHFNDIDGDGDMDILGYNSSPDGRIVYHRNLSEDSTSTCNSPSFVLETLCWGNFALKIGGTNTVGCFNCPCRMRRPGTDHEDEIDVTDLSAPEADQSEAARRDDTVSSVYALDNDGDGDMEILVGDIASNNTLMVHNGGTNMSASMDISDTLFPSYDVSAYFNGFHYHTYMDVDNDGKKDLLAMANDHENKFGLYYYKNTNTTPSPVFSFEEDAFLQNQMIDGGEDASAYLFDYDSDGLLDLFVGKNLFDEVTGHYLAGLMLYKNTGTQTSPAFELVTDDFAGLTPTNLFVAPICPAFGDLDGDGDADMIIGREDGKMYYYNNIAGAGNPVNFQLTVPNYMSIDVGKFATPQLFDLDRDGLIDLVTGCQRGIVSYFRNTGTTSNPFYDSIPTDSTLGCIVIQGPNTTDGYTAPFLYDSLGKTRLLVANENGNIYMYDQIDANLGGCFHLSGTVYNPSESTRIKYNINVNGGDLNGDGLTDIVVGQSTGGVDLRYQFNPTAGISTMVSIRPTFEIFPNPVNDEMDIKVYHPGNGPSLLRVFNSLGELIRDKIITEETTRFKTSEMAPGIYFVQLTSGNYSSGRKVVVRH